MPLIFFGIFYFLINSYSPSDEKITTENNDKPFLPQKIEIVKPVAEKEKKKIISDVDFKSKKKKPQASKNDSKNTNKNLKSKNNKKVIAKKRNRNRKKNRHGLSAQEHGKRHTNLRPWLSAKVAANQQLNLKSWRDKNIKKLLKDLSPEESSKNEDVDKTSDGSQTILFKVTFQSLEGKALSGGLISTNSPVDLKEANALPYTVLAENISIVGTTNISGYSSFKLKETGYPTNLYFLYNNNVFKIFSKIVNKENAWENQKIKLNINIVNKGVVFGKVKNLGNQPIKDAIVSNMPIRSMDEHKAYLKKKDYRFTISNVKGEYYLGGIELNQEISIYCFLSNYPLVKSKKINFTKENRILWYSFKIQQARLEPAVWAGKIVDQKGDPVKDAKIGTTFFESYSKAIAHSQFYTSDEKGYFTFIVAQYEDPIKLYLYDQEIGNKLIQEHIFERSEKYFSVSEIEIGSKYKGSIGLRLQDKNGKDINKGWIGSDVVSSEESLTTLISIGGYGNKVSSSGETLIGDIPSNESIELFYSNSLGEKKSLGTFSVKENETLHKIIRLDGNANLPSSIVGTVVDENRNFLENITVVAKDTTGAVILKTATNDLGVFDLNPLSKYFRYTLVFIDESSGLEHKYKSSILLDSEIKVIGSVEFKLANTFNFLVVKSEAKVGATANTGVPFEKIPNANISLISNGVSTDSQTSDENGNVKFIGLKLDVSYTVKITHPEYEDFQLLDFSPKENHRFELVPRKIIIVKLTGHDFNTPMFVKSLIAIDNGDQLLPDKSSGNEYAEVLNTDTIYFLTPPQKPFYIYVGAMPKPWGAKLYGPFQMTSNDNITVELALEKTSPISVELSGAKNPGLWNLSIFGMPDKFKNESVDEDIEITESGEVAVVEEAEKENPPQEIVAKFKSYQLHSALHGGKKSLGYYLAAGRYRFLLSAVHGNYFDLNEIVEVTKGQVFKFEFLPKNIDIPSGGYVKSYIVSDRFDLGISIENSHHQQECPGFETDHLGGEEYFKAEHLGVYKAPDGKTNISWTKVAAKSNGMLDFKKKYPGKEGDYAVAYAQFTVTCDRERKVWLGVTADDGVKGWHNGKRIIYRHLATPMTAKDQKLVGNVNENDPALILKKGENLFILKVDNSWGGWALRTRFVDPETYLPITDLSFKNGDGVTSVVTK